MPSITGYTAGRTQDIEDAIIVGAAVVGGHLILTRHDGGTIDAGDIRGGEQLPHTTVVQVAATSVGTSVTTNYTDFGVSLAVAGFVKYRADTKLILEYTGCIYTPDTFTQYEAACNIAGANRLLVNDFGASGGKSGMVQLTGIAAGTYTGTMKKRRVTGSGTVYDAHANGRSSLMITETF